MSETEQQELKRARRALALLKQSRAAYRVSDAMLKFVEGDWRDVLRDVRWYTTPTVGQPIEIGELLGRKVQATEHGLLIEAGDPTDAQMLLMEIARKMSPTAPWRVEGDGPVKDLLQKAIDAGVLEDD